MSFQIDLRQPDETDLDAIHAFLRQSYWSPEIPFNIVARACENSICVMARDETGALIGFARTVTDQATFAWLADVFVLPAHRGKGIARALVRALLEHPDTQGIRRWLLATRDAHGVYAPLGFVPLDAPDRVMQMRLPSPYGAPAG